MITALLPLVLALGQTPASAPPIRLQLDATQAPRHLFHTTMTIPARPGPLTLAYPNWIPGEHAGMGPISDLAGLVITVGDTRLLWRRDLVQMHAIHCQVPAGASEVKVELDYLSPLSEGTFTDGPASTSKLAIIDWHLMLVYPRPDSPAPNYTDTVSIAASIRAPKGWRCVGSLPRDGSSEPVEGWTRFAPLSLTMLVDHPVLLGANCREVDLTPGQTPEHHLDIVADSPADLEVSDERIGHYKSLVAQAAALMGARRYERYHFLLSLSDRTSHFGLEHHECSDDRQAEKFLIDDDEHRLDASLLSHEYFHSWNGKFRRPRGLATGDYQTPMRTDLLWVYEGLTEYYGDVLAARCGNWTPAEYREYMAKTIAALDHTPGRTWRPLQDTCDAAPILYSAGGTYGSWRRGTDFYDEGELFWLEADTIIRQQTKGAKSLDDFCRAFHGEGFAGGSLSGQAPRVEPYEFDDVCAAMNALAAHDWRAFFRERLDALSTETPKSGLAAAGYELVYTDAPNAFIKSAGDFTSSFGLSIKDSGEADNVVRGMAAEAAGVGPGMRVMGVNGRKYSPEALKSAIASGEAFDLLVQNEEDLATVRVEYTGGVRVPHLKRIEDRPDLLAEILKPLPGAMAGPVSDPPSR